MTPDQVEAVLLAVVQEELETHAALNGLKRMGCLGVVFTDEQTGQIRRLTEAGNIAQAQEIIMCTLDDKPLP